jgi:flavin-dependent dehydrogenase
VAFSLAVNLETRVTLAATLTLNQAASRQWPVVVIGAGPAGALAARALAQNGLDVLVVDKAAFPRTKVCGCCLNGRALGTLRAAGLGDLSEKLAAVPLGDFYLAGRGHSARVPLSGGMALSREAFDTALVQKAIEAGAAFLPRTMAILPIQSNHKERAFLLSQGEAAVRVTAQVALAADGLGGQLLARAGFNPAPPAPGARMGAGLVVQDGPSFYRPGTIYMACSSFGYLGLVRLEDGRLDLAAALDVQAVRSAGGPAALAVRILQEVNWPTPAEWANRAWRGTLPLTRRPVYVAAHRVFALGDAAGYVEPFTGEGMAWALASALAVAPLAARAVDRWHPGLLHEWNSQHRMLIRRRQFVCRAAAGLLRRPMLTRACIQTLRFLPGLAGPVVRYFNQTAKASK